MPSADFHIDDISLFSKKALQWASLFNTLCCLNSQNYHHSDRYSKFNILIAAGAKEELIGPQKSDSSGFSSLQNFLDRHPSQWIPGFLSYDLKNELESLNSRHPNEQDIPSLYFFIPEHLVLIRENQVHIQSDSPHDIFRQITETSLLPLNFRFQGEIKSKMDKSEYLRAFHQLQRHIHQGDIYEVNLCQEFFAEKVELDPLPAFWKLSSISPTPFSCFFKYGSHYILSASPERFLAKRQTRLISQPIKGTAPRGKTPEEDETFICRLRESKKEISENIMIVDLVRNDLTRSALAGTVYVEELMKIYSFPQVHQMISTIVAEEENNLPRSTVIQRTFPPGSMTGAPKISAMKLIDRYESSRRGLYAGSIGYFSPDGDYDFNVVIRSLLYNSDKKRLSFHVGGAITAAAIDEQEYRECLLKAKAILELLNSHDGF